MTDPYLEAHRLARHAYLASGLAPLSLRDQILRGSTLVARLHRLGEIGPARPLLVVGAGAAGVAAALAAARLGVPTSLFDAEDRAFALQRLAGSRHIDPAAYDWPVDHWDAGFLHPGGAIPPALPFRADYASRLAFRWTAILQAESRAPSPLLACHWNAEVTAIATIRLPNTTLGSRLTLRKGGTASGAALIWAAGAKQERTTIAGSAETYAGPPFWGPDTLTALGPRDRVLVSGAGDGALQDAIRAITGRDDMAALLRQLAIPPAAASLVQSAEDRAHRIRVWLPDGTAIAEADSCFAELDRRHRQAVAIALRKKGLRQAVAAVAGASRPMVCVVHRKPWLTAYYGLNRFLALLLDTMLRDAGRPPLLYPGSWIGDIAAAANARWSLAFHGAAAPRPRRFDQVIVRHGYDDLAPIPLPPPLIRGHLLPYHGA